MWEDVQQVGGCAQHSNSTLKYMASGSFTSLMPPAVMQV